MKTMQQSAACSAGVSARGFRRCPAAWTGIRGFTLENLAAGRRQNPQPGRPRYAFSLVEMLIVIAVIALLASLIVGGAKIAGPKNKISRVNAERAQLETAIDSYKQATGSYPPDNPNNPAQNQLYYELTGADFQERPQPRFVPRMGDPLTISVLNSAFGRGSIANSTPAVNFYQNIKASQIKATTINPANVEIRYLAVPVSLNPGDPGDPNHPTVKLNPGLPGEINPWRYVSSNPTNNPGAFDLWAEFRVGNEIRTNGNWRN